MPPAYPLYLFILVIAFASRVLSIGTNVPQYMFSNKKPFSLDETKVNAGVITTQVTLDSTRCDFKYSLSRCSDLDLGEPMESPQEEEKKLDAYPLIEKLNGQCFESKPVDWRYRVCVGQEIMQMYQGQNGDSYNLGKYNERDTLAENGAATKVQVYTDGDKCLDRGGRKSFVTFVCGDEDAIVNIAEDPMCTYKITIAHSSLCGKNSPFSRYYGSKSSGKSRNEDHWMINLEPTVDGSYVCSAYLTRMGSLENKPSFCFKEFSMSITSEDQSLSYDSHVARHINRVAYEQNQLVSYQDQSQGTMPAVATVEGFKGSDLEFLQLKAAVRRQ